MDPATKRIHCHVCRCGYIVFRRVMTSPFSCLWLWIHCNSSLYGQSISRLWLRIHCNSSNYDQSIFVFVAVDILYFVALWPVHSHVCGCGYIVIRQIMTGPFSHVCSCRYIVMHRVITSPYSRWWVWIHCKLSNYEHSIFTLVAVDIFQYVIGLHRQDFIL